MQGHGEEPPDEPNSSSNGENDEPEPEDGVDLLVDDVEGHDAEGVELLYAAGGAVLVEGALGDLLAECA